MTRDEKLLIHQIHPAKLLTDFGTSFASAWLLWNELWLPAVLVAFLPSMLITLVILQFADLERLQRSWFGHYVVRRMNRRVTTQRIVGQLVVWAAAIAHVPWLIPFGYFVIVLAWLDGLWADEQRA